MPLYDYRCRFCGVEYKDQLESILSPSVKPCPTCQHEELTRVIAPIGGFTLSGFSYSNGYSNSQGH